MERILSGPSFFEELKPYLGNYFLQIILPVLLTGKVEAVTEITSGNNSLSSISNNIIDKFCKCSGLKEERMIAYDNPNCPIEWFLYIVLELPGNLKASGFVQINCKST